MIGHYIVFAVLFLGGIFLLGISMSLPGFQAVAFVGGILIVCIALAYMMREHGGATKRSRSWEN